MEIYRKPWIALRIESKDKYCKIASKCREGNLAVWYNPETKQHKKVFIKDSDKPEFRQLIQEGVDTKQPSRFHTPVEGVGKKGFVPRGNITELQEITSPLTQSLTQYGLEGATPTRKKGKIIKVYDGNTVLVSDGRGVEVVVKIRGLYTEPLRKRGDEVDDPLALRQRETLESFLLGQDVELLYDAERLRDSTGTSLATIYLSGETPYPSTDLFTGAVTYRTEQLSELERRDPRFNKNVKQLMLNRGMALSYDDKQELGLQELFERKDKERKEKLDFVKAQSKLPELERQRQKADKWGFWDYVSADTYAVGSIFNKLAFDENVKESFRGKTEFANVAIRGEIETAEKIASGELGYYNPYDKTAPRSYEKGSRIGEYNPVQAKLAAEYSKSHTSISRFWTNVLYSPVSYIGIGKGFLTKSVDIGGKSKGITIAGEKLWAEYVAKYGKNLGKWHFFEAVRLNPNLLQKEGLRIFWTNFELIPKKYTDIAYKYAVSKPFSKVNNGASAAIAKLTTKINELHVAESALRKFQTARVSLIGGRQLPDIPEVSTLELRLAFGDLMGEVGLKKKLAMLEIDSISLKAKAELGNRYGTKLGEIVESGKTTTQEVKNIVGSLEVLHKKMATSEKARGLLSETREYYIRHALTPAAKKAMEIDEKVLGLLDIDASFSVGRKIEGSVGDINKGFREMGADFDLFEPNAIKALRTRYKESIQATQTFDFLNSIKKQYGVDAKYFGELRKTHGFSKIPVLKDVLLPKNVIDTLESTTTLGAHVKTLAPPNTIIRKGFDAYTGVRRTFQRTVTVWFAAFHSRNFLSAGAENAWKGVWNPLDYLKIEKSLKGTSDPIHNLIRKLKGGTTAEESAKRFDVEFVSSTGEEYTNARFLEIARKGNILDQPGFIGVSGFKPWQRLSGLEGVAEQANALPAAVLKSIENRVRLTLLRQRLILGDTPEQAIRFVNDAHVDYTRQLSTLEQVGENVIPFYRWTVANPIIQAKKLVTHPGSFAAIPKATDAWHDEEDKIMLNYKPDYLQGAILVKLPDWAVGTDDAFGRVPLATEDLTMMSNNFKSTSYAFYWDEALANPDIIRRFARYNLDIDWLSRGGGVAEASGNVIIITYKTTGASIIVQMASDGQTLEFFDGDTGAVIKSFGTSVRASGKVEVLVDNQPLKKVLNRYTYPWFTAPGELYSGEDWRWGREIDDTLTYLFRKFGGSRAEFTLDEIADPTISQREKFMELVLGINVYHAADWIDLPEELADEVIEKEITEYRGTYAGCGF